MHLRKTIEKESVSQVNVSIEDYHSAYGGPVALLGGGESVKKLNLDAIAEAMPIIGINESWRGFATGWRVFVDFELQQFIKPETVFFPCAKNSKPVLPPRVAGITIEHLARKGSDPDFMGFNLDVGTYAYFAGMLALEVATWCGFDPIYLLGYDCSGGYWMDDEKRTPGGAKTHAVWERQLSSAIDLLRGRDRFCAKMSSGRSR
jgi:hypothetical protein